MTDGKSMDDRRKDKADEIITKMKEDGASGADIKAQKKANKDAFGHEGSFKY